MKYYQCESCFSAEVAKQGKGGTKKFKDVSSETLKWQEIISEKYWMQIQEKKCLY